MKEINKEQILFSIPNSLLEAIFTKNKKDKNWKFVIKNRLTHEIKTIKESIQERMVESIIKNLIQGNYNKTLTLKKIEKSQREFKLKVENLIKDTNKIKK